MKIQYKSEEMIITLIFITRICICCLDTATANPESQVVPLVRSASKNTEYGYMFRILSHYSPRLTEGIILVPYYEAWE
jgi:hypothetical protein